MPDIFRAWRYFVGLISLLLLASIMAPKGCALHLSEEWVQGVIEQAVEKYTDESPFADMELDMDAPSPLLDADDGPVMINQDQ